MKRLKKSAAWRRQQSQIEVTPEALFIELDGRKLDTLDKCRVAWEHAADPVSLAAGVTMLDAPEWLTDALIAVLTTGMCKGLEQHLRNREIDMTHRHRATAIAGERIVGQRWEDAQGKAESLMRESFKDVPHVGIKAMEKSYLSVCRGIDNPGRYFLAPTGFARLRMKALRRVQALIKKQLIGKVSLPDQPV